MRVLITGGTGIVGKETTARMIAKGWDVRVIGIEPDVQIDGAAYAQCDILDYAATLEQMRGCDAVIHLAAIRSPILAPGQDVFNVNVTGTFNVFEAASVCGIKRVVQASSINAFGCFYGKGEISPQYLPIDEDHASNTTDPYSFSKQMVEEIGAYYWRRDGISSVAMRFPAVYHAGFTENEHFQRKRVTMRLLFDELLALPESERRARIATARQQALDYRATRPLEYDPNYPNGKRMPQDDLLPAVFASDRANFWALLDERDAAQSLEKGVTADYEGAHALFINDDHNAIGYPSRALASLFFPEVPPHKYVSDLVGTEALVSILKARALIGFKPEYSVGSLPPP